MDLIDKLTDAVKCGDSTTVESTLRKKISMRTLNVFATLIDGSLINRLNQERMSPLHCAVESNQKEVLSLLVEMGAKVEVRDAHGRTPLYRAAGIQNVSIVSLLLEKGAEVDAPDNCGITPLCEALQKGDTETVRLLIEKEATINREDSDGQAPLHFAAIRGDIDIVKLLLIHKAAINATNKMGYTPLHWAAKLGKTEIVSLLVDGEAATDAPDSQGMTPLHLAAQKGEIETVRLLLNKGAKINVENRWKYTPLCLAAESRHEPTIVHLLQCGAYSYPNAHNDTKLEAYWKRMQLQGTRDTAFYTKLLVAGFNIDNQALSKPRINVKNNVEATIVEWFKPLAALSPEDIRTLTPNILRAFPRLIHWIDFIHEEKSGNLNAFFFKRVEQEDLPLNMSSNLFIDKLQQLYALPSSVARYFVMEVMRHPSEHRALHERFWQHDWTTGPCEPPMAASGLIMKF